MKIVALAVLLACGPVRTGSPPETALIAIRVENVSYDEVSIYVIGRRTRRLGEVEGLSTLVLYVKRSDLRPDGTYRVIARRQFRGAFASTEDLTPERGSAIRLLVHAQGISASSR